MTAVGNYLTGGSSIIFRIFSYVFLRYIPGHPFPPILAALFTIWLSGFVYKALTTSAWEVLVDEINVISKPVEDEDQIKKQLHVPASEHIEELDVSENVVLVEKDRHVLRTLLTGLPSPSSTILNLTTFCINLVLLAMIWDLTYRAALFYPATDLSFTRLGYVSDRSANVFIREPDNSVLPIYLYYRYADIPKRAASVYEGSWKSSGIINSLTEDTDFATTLTITGLSPDTRYQYATSTNKSAYFVTAPEQGSFSKRDPLSTSFTFLHTSCIIPHFPYNPLDHPLEIPGLRYLSPWLAILKPAFMLFLGDFIYVDVPARHGSDIFSYRRAYRQVYDSPAWPLVTSTKPTDKINLWEYDQHDIPWLHVYDDHEIADDWAANTTGVYPAAFDPYNIYHVAPNPPSYRPSTSIFGFTSPGASRAQLTSKHIQSEITYSQFTHGPASFFMLDTRRFRSTPNLNDSTMLGQQQLSDLLTWINAPVPTGFRFKFLISSVPFAKNWPVNSKDTWAGYLKERRIILEALWTRMATSSLSFVILSGDRHEFAATAFPPPTLNSSNTQPRWPRERCTVYEFSASPLNMFYFPIGTYHQQKGDEEDVMIKYIPEGNSKFGSITISEEVGGQSVLKYRLIVDGRETWSYVLTKSHVGAWERWV